MKKPYTTLDADILILLDRDVLTTSNGIDHGMGGDVAPDEDWQVGIGNSDLF